MILLRYCKTQVFEVIFSTPIAEPLIIRTQIAGLKYFFTKIRQAASQKMPIIHIVKSIFPNVS